MLVPSPTVIVPVARIPNVARVVPVLSGTLPVPVAGVGAEAGDVEADAADELELADDEDDAPELVCDELVLLEPPLMPASALCTADAICELTRLSAV